MSRGFFICSVIALSVSACDNPITCRDPCPNRAHTRDFFCGCFDPKEREKQSQRNNGEITTAYSDCVCQYSGGIVGAWFRYQPSIYKKFGKITVNASSCIDLTVCELTPHSDGGSHYTTLTGKIDIDVENWNETQNLINGGSSWHVLGRLSRQANQLPHSPMPHLKTRLAGALNRLERILEPTAFENTIDSCISACDAKSPFCFQDELGSRESYGLKSIYASLLPGKNDVSAHQMHEMFGINVDPCNRSGLKFVGETLTNEGDACTLQSDIPAMQIAATIDVPTSIVARYTRDKDLIKLDFPDRERRARLAFTDSYINADWGGEIKSAFSDNKHIGFSVGERSCIRMKLK